MLAHKVDGEHPSIYSDLPLATQKLERWAEARDSLPPRMAATNGSNVMCSQMPGNLFPLPQVEGQLYFPVWAATIGNDMSEEDPYVEQKGEEETKPSADEEVEALGEVEEADQSIKYIACFAKAVELYQKKNKDCFGCGSPDHLIWDCPKNISRSIQKTYLNMREGTANKGGWALRSWLPLSGCLQMRWFQHKEITEDSCLEPGPTHSLVWAWKHSLSQDQWQELWALLDNVSMVSEVTTEFVEAHILDIGPLSDRVDSTVNVNGFGRLSIWPLGYVIIRVQVEWVWCYDKD